jgi:hypothetical protein
MYKNLKIKNVFNIGIYIYIGRDLEDVVGEKVDIGDEIF